jgi:hypothetical protein
MTTTHVKSAVMRRFVDLHHEPEGDMKNPLLQEGADALGFEFEVLKAFQFARRRSGTRTKVRSRCITRSGKDPPEGLRVVVGLGAAARVNEETWRRAGGHASRVRGGKDASSALIGDSGVVRTRRAARRPSRKGGTSPGYRFESFEARCEGPRPESPSKGALTVPVVGKDRGGGNPPRQIAVIDAPSRKAGKLERRP